VVAPKCERMIRPVFALTDVRGQTAFVRVLDFDIAMIDAYGLYHWLAKGEKANY